MQKLEFEKIQKLTDVCFQTQQYTENFPQVFFPERSDFLFSLYFEEELASFCALFPTYFQVQNQLLFAYGLGSVATLPKYQGKGFARQNLIKAEEKAWHNGADFIFLFSEKNSLYDNLGYRISGDVPLISLDTHFLRSHFTTYEIPLEAKFQFLITKALADEKRLTQIWQFIISHSHQSESLLSYLEFKDLMKIKNMSVSLFELHGHIQSLCFFNKGDDFQNVVHGIYYSNLNAAMLTLKNMIQTISKQIYFFPGAFAREFLSLFEAENIPNMYVKLNPEKNDLQWKNLFVRSLQGV